MLNLIHARLLITAVIAFVCVACPVANAATVSLSTIVNNPTSPYQFEGKNSVQVYFTFSGPAVSRIAVGEKDTTPFPANQNYDTVGALLQSVFNTTNFIGTGFQVDLASTIMTGNIADFVSTVAYRYLAVHFGGYEAFFDFGVNGVAANTHFHISNIFKVSNDADAQAGGLSNFRAYSVTPTATPIPGAVWLFGTGLLGLLGIGKRSVKKLSA